MTGEAVCVGLVVTEGDGAGEIGGTTGPTASGSPPPPREQVEQQEQHEDAAQHRPGDLEDPPVAIGEVHAVASVGPGVEPGPALMSVV